MNNDKRTLINCSDLNSMQSPEQLALLYGDGAKDAKWLPKEGGCNLGVFTFCVGKEELVGKIVDKESNE